jgi:hypothetical protein
MGEVRQRFRHVVGCIHAAPDWSAVAAKSSQLVKSNFSSSCGFMRHTSYPSRSQFNCCPLRLTALPSNRVGQWNLWRSSRLYQITKPVLLP